MSDVVKKEFVFPGRNAVVSYSRGCTREDLHIVMRWVQEKISEMAQKDIKAIMEEEKKDAT